MKQLLRTDELESRAYQEVIAASAVDENTLVVLPTGLGKTIIAAMVASRKLNNGKVLFLAPTRPLVEQHLETFDTFLEIPRVDMEVMTGNTRPEKRYELWRERSCFFATPQVVENDLVSGEVPNEEFSLVIFDEAHRASGKYPYVFISEKFRCQKLAMTASPGGNKEEIMDVAEKLEITNFEVRTEEDADVEPYIEDKELNWHHVSLDNRFKQAKQDLDAAKRNQLKELKRLGQAESVSNVNKGELLDLQGEIRSKLSSSDDSKLYEAVSVVATALKITQAIELLETQGVSQCHEYLKGLENDSSKAAARALQDEKLRSARSMVEYLRKKGEEHPKLEKLREILDIDEGENAIVFTEYRASASNIAEELETSGLRAETFVGQQGDAGMSQTEQIESLERFEDGDFDVLVSTSVGEEGLDVPAVDHVVFYEPVSSGIRDIQRSGRTGRQEEGSVHVLIAENTRDEGVYWSSHHKKKRMKATLRELKDDDRVEGDGQRSLESYEEQEGSSLEIVADDRENQVAKELSRLEVEVSTERLEVGDFLVSDRAAVERKEAADFVDSILDGRLFDQLKELSEFEKPSLIIEGDELFGQRNVEPEAIRGALATVSLDFEIPVMWSTDEKGTAELLKSMARREQEESDREVAVRGERTGSTLKDRQEYMVAGIPGVNTKLARRLLEEFGSVEEVFRADGEALQDVDGIGEKTAEEMREVIEADY